MKSNLPKILFMLFVVALIGFSIYFVNHNQNKNGLENLEEIVEIKPEILHDLRLGIAEFDTINPILSTNRNVQEISKIIYEPLITLDQNYKPQACLATEWSKIEGNGYLIKLRQGVKWHDGSNFTANDVKFTIDKLKTEAITSVYASCVKNVTVLDVIDEYTVKLSLDSDVPFFEYYLTFPIMSASYYEGQDFATTSKNRNPVGTGKYKATWDENDTLVLKEYSNYWDKKDETYSIQNIYVYFYNTMGEVYNSFKIGNIDLITTNNLYVENYIGTIGYNKKEYQGKEYDFLAFNTTNTVLSHQEIRKAISYAIDRSLLNANFYNNKYYIADFPLDYNNWLYNQNSTSSGFNPDQVAVILSENGWELVNGVWQKKENYTTIRAKLSLVVNSSNENRVSVCENIKEELEAVGIQVTIRKATDYQYQNYLNNKNYDMILLGTRGTFNPDLTTYLGQGNYSNYTNDELNTILSEVKNIQDGNLLTEKYNRIYEIYKTDMPFVSLYFNRNTLCYSPYLMGEITPNCYNIFYNIEKWYRQY